MSVHPESPLAELAREVGLLTVWQDASGRRQEVRDEVLVTLLGALGYPANTLEKCADSSRRLAAERASAGLPRFAAAWVNEPIRLPLGPKLRTTESSVPIRIVLEHGQTIDARARIDADGSLQVPGVRSYGYHRLELGNETVDLAIAPKRCFGIEEALGPDVSDPRVWGLTCQIYSLRRNQATGMGDFNALAELCARAGSAGANAVGINPVHANFSADPTRYSPYAPSSRLFLNPLYIDPVPVFGSAVVGQALQAAVDAKEWSALDRHPHIQWPRVAAVRMQVFAYLFARHTSLLNSERLAELRAFREAGGEALEDHARFEALDRAQRALHRFSWQQWPDALRDPRSDAVEAFAQAEAYEVSFHVFLQWLAQRGLAQVQKTARNAGMSIGLIGDLAVGTDPGGSHAWSRKDEIIDGLVCGAPPDVYNPLGQSWGLSAFSPVALQRTGFRAFIEMLRASLAQCGGVRIDHVLGLTRMWLVPTGEPAHRGAYLRYPFEDLLRLVSLESWRNRAIIIGENLGTVPPGFNEKLSERGILGTSVLWFEREQSWGEPVARFRAPSQWPAETVATTTTHDLPTCRGWWKGVDLQRRAELGLLAEADDLDQLLQHRGAERSLLMEAVGAVGLAHGTRADSPEPPIAGLCAFVARTPARLALVPVEDLFGLAEQPNMPGTIEGHPNWQQRLTETVANCWSHADVQERLLALQQERPGDPKPMQR
ncbi:MAG: 4-alpha-glucanotransferase [Burkholderiaceae bacterium]|jgi:4-alpha-glucanotransferase